MRLPLLVRALLSSTLLLFLLNVTGCQQSIAQAVLDGSSTITAPAGGALYLSQKPAPPQPVSKLPDPVDPKTLTQEELEIIAIEPAGKNEGPGSRIKAPMLPLFIDKEITYTGSKKYRNTTLRFLLHVPENMRPGKKYPLILWLHGAGEVGDDNREQLVHLHHILPYLTGSKKRDFFLLVPQAPRDHAAWEASTGEYFEPLEEGETVGPDVEVRELEFTTIEMRNGQQVEKKQKRKFKVLEAKDQAEARADSPLAFSLAMVDQTSGEYPVDTDRITVAGLSTGGDGTWRALEYRPELFAAAVPLVSWDALLAKELKKSPILKKIPIWAIYSSNDRGIDRAREDFERVEKAGCNVRKSEFGLCGHNAWTPAMLQADIFSWLLSRAKKDGDYIAVDDPNVKPEDMKGIVEVAIRDPRRPTVAPAAPKPEEIAAVPTATTAESTSLKPLAPYVQPLDLKLVHLPRRPNEPGPVFELTAKNNTDQTLKAVKLSLHFGILEPVSAGVGAQKESEKIVSLAFPSVPPGKTVSLRVACKEPKPGMSADIIGSFNSLTDNQRMVRLHYGTPRTVAAVPKTMPPRPSASPGNPAPPMEIGMPGVATTGMGGMGMPGGMTMPPPMGPPTPGMQMMGMGSGGMPHAKGDVYAVLLLNFFRLPKIDEEAVLRIYGKIPNPTKIQLLPALVHQAHSMEHLLLLEKMIDMLPEETPRPGMHGMLPMTPDMPPSVRLVPREEKGSLVIRKPEKIPSAPGRVVVEECDKEWEMSPTTLYGLFPVGWEKEADLVPEFVKSTDGEELVAVLKKSIAGDGRTFHAVCHSVLRLENYPMSSPWFETSGGRMRSDIKYKLSAKGRVLVDFLTDAKLPPEKTRIAREVLEKIAVILDPTNE